MTDRKPAAAVRLFLSALLCASLVSLSCASGKPPAGAPSARTPLPSAPQAIPPTPFPDTPPAPFPDTPPTPFPDAPSARIPSAPLPPQTLEEAKDSRLTMIAVGDNLIHRELINAAKTEADDVFDFDKYYTRAAPLIRSADIAFINQETLIAGKEFGYSGYPAFNGPKDIGRAIVRLGFDVVNHATNHTMDKGERAVFEVMDFWDGQQGVLVLGINRSAEIREDVSRNIIVKNGISVGFLSYTYGTNGIPLPKDKPFLVSLIDTEVMAREIDALRPLCDFLVVSMHWGNEYEYKPSSRQQELARFLAARNVDLVIGHHPHVLQPLAAVPREGAAPMVCFFSLGNFLSAQNQPPRLLGGMMKVVIKKTASAPHTVTVEEAELLPLVTHYEAGYTNFAVYPLDEYTDDIASRHLLLPKFKGVDYFYGLVPAP